MDMQMQMEVFWEENQFQEVNHLVNLRGIHKVVVPWVVIVLGINNKKVKNTKSNLI